VETWEARFGRAFYVSERGETAIAEIGSHGKNATHVIRYRLNLAEAKVLDLTDPALVKIWGSPAGEHYEITKAIAFRARAAGYDAIRFPSLRGPGNNFAIFDNFDRILKPQMVVPAR